MFEFATELGHLLSGLPVHEGGFALGFVDLLFVLLALNLALDGATWRENLLHDSSGEVHAGFDEHGVDDFVCACELSTPGGIIPQPRAP